MDDNDIFDHVLFVIFMHFTNQSNNNNNFWKGFSLDAISPLFPDPIHYH